MNLTTAISLAVAVTVLPATTLAAAVPVVPLPTIGSAVSLGLGSHPTLGSNGATTLLSFRDASGSYKIWNPATGAFDTATSLTGSQCVLGQGAFFCQTEVTNIDGDLNDAIRAFDYAANNIKTRTFPLGSLGPSSIKGAYGKSIVVETAASDALRLTRSPGAIDESTVIGGNPTISPDPIFFGDHIIYRSFSPNEGWRLTSWHTQPMSSIKVPNEPGLIATGAGFSVYFTQWNSTTPYLWFPGGPIEGENGGIDGYGEGSIEQSYFVPSHFGCTAIRGVADEQWSSVKLIEGSNCGAMPRALFAATFYDNYQPFFVGELSANTEYALYDNLVAYVDVNEEVVLLKVDKERTVSFGDNEPNNNEGTASVVAPWYVGAQVRGSINSPGDPWDVYKVYLMGGKTYSFLAKSFDDCSHESNDTRIHFRGDGVDLTVDDGPGNSRCAEFDFLPPADGVYFVRIEGGVDEDPMDYDLIIK